MSRTVKKWIRQIIPDRVKKFVSYSDEVEFGTVSFSQYGEDMIMRNFFPGKSDGFYIDIGAHHPVRYSNSYHFYKCGWSGITIDPLPGVKSQFEAWRPRDLFLGTGVSDETAVLEYYRFKNPLQNTFSASQASQVDKDVNPVEEVCRISVHRLDDLLEQHLPPGTKIDFMSVDAEGYDLKVLRSNDWNKYRPTRLLVEDFDFVFGKVQDTPIVRFLAGLDYEMESFANKSLFFKDALVPGNDSI